jgi:hypothetical protein
LVDRDHATGSASGTVFVNVNVLEVLVTSTIWFAGGALVLTLGVCGVLIVSVRLCAIPVALFVAVIVNTVDPKYVSLAIVRTPVLEFIEMPDSVGDEDHVIVPASAVLVNVNVSCC